MDKNTDIIDEIFKEILIDVKCGITTIYNYREQENFMKFMDLLSEDIEKLSKYTYDGRFEEILFEALNKSIRNDWSYNKFFCAIKTGLEALSVPCVILIPLNYIDDRKIEKDMAISDNIILFKTDKPNITYSLFREPKVEETSLEKYFKQNVYKLLLRDHIEKAKDENFFNFPLLSILINNIDSSVVCESGRIVEAVYTFIRMLDFKNKLGESGWGYMFHNRTYPAGVYGVYYNKEGLTHLPLGNEANGYGYSMRFKFTPILDVSTESFLKSIKEFNALLCRYINYCFMDKNNYSNLELMRIAKWQNSIRMFNTAYEFASQERYDSTIILLLTILESLFIKNKGNKKQHVILALQEFFKNDTTITDHFIRENIEQAYKSRNRFVHEGIGVENENVYSKPLNSYQGLTPGMKPFVHIGIYHYPGNIRNLINLFNIIINVIRDYMKTLHT